MSTWSWRSCFAVVKHNKKPKKRPTHSSSKSMTNGSTHLQTNTRSETTIANEYLMPSSCIIKIDSLTEGNQTNFLDEDCIEQVIFDRNIRTTQLDAIVEDSNEENSDDLDETISPIRLCCDREIIKDSNDLHSRLFDLSQMNHVVTQFNENGNLLAEFRRQIEKLKLKTDDIRRVSSQMPRDAELLEARYSTLLASIESLSLLLKIGQIPACRSLINRLIASIEQRIEQLNQLVSITSIDKNTNRKEFNDDDDLLSFRSALSSYEHLCYTSS